MICLSPISLVDPKGTSNAQRITVPCGKCLSCLSRRRDDWSFRLKQEVKICTSAFFITLTYSDENLPRSDCGLPCVSKRDVQLFMKRLRKSIEPFKIRYFLVSEYGSKTFRPHYHFILFNLPKSFDVDKIIKDAWQKGNIDVGTVTAASIHYVTKYCLSYAELPKNFERPFMLCSRKPALGSNYLTDNMREWHNDDLKNYIVSDGYKQCLPRYYRDRLFSKEQREIISEKTLKMVRANELKLDNKTSKFNNSRIPFGFSSWTTEKKLDYIRKQKLKLSKDSKL